MCKLKLDKIGCRKLVVCHPDCTSCLPCRVLNTHVYVYTSNSIFCLAVCMPDAVFSQSGVL